MHKKKHLHYANIIGAKKLLRWRYFVLDVLCVYVRVNIICYSSLFPSHLFFIRFFVFCVFYARLNFKFYFLSIEFYATVVGRW